MSKHPIFGKHPNVISGSMTGSYCGFPIRTSNNIVLGTYCLANDDPIKLSQEKVDAIDNMVTKLGAYLERHNTIQDINSEKLLLGLKYASEHFPTLTVSTVCALLDFRTGLVSAANDLHELTALGLIDEKHKLTNAGASLLEKLNLYQSSFKSTQHKLTREEDFDALFEGL